jgi:hypothetical protein
VGLLARITSHRLATDADELVFDSGTASGIRLDPYRPRRRGACRCGGRRAREGRLKTTLPGSVISKRYPGWVLVAGSVGCYGPVRLGELLFFYVSFLFLLYFIFPVLLIVLQLCLQSLNLGSF